MIWSGNYEMVWIFFECMDMIWRFRKLKLRCVITRMMHRFFLSRTVLAAPLLFGVDCDFSNSLLPYYGSNFPPFLYLCAPIQKV